MGGSGVVGGVEGEVEGVLDGEGEVKGVLEREGDVEGGLGNVITGGGITVVVVSSGTSGSGMISLINIGIRPMAILHKSTRTYTILYVAKGSGIFVGKLTVQTVLLVSSPSKESCLLGLLCGGSSRPWLAEDLYILYPENDIPSSSAFSSGLHNVPLG